MVHLTWNHVYVGKKGMERGKEWSDLHHLSKSRTVARSAWAEEADSIETGDCNTQSKSLAWGAGCLCVGYSLSLTSVLG